MSAAHKSYIPVPVPSQKSQGSQRRPQSRVTPPNPTTKPVTQSSPTPTVKPTTKSVARVPVAPTQKQLASRQLRSLCLLERIVAVITFCLLGSTLGIYAWTVYIPKVWLIPNPSKLSFYSVNLPLTWNLPTLLNPNLPSILDREVPINSYQLSVISYQLSDVSF